MNTPNNKRKKESMERIEKVFIELLQTKELNEISVSDICKHAGLNRTTFYANYTDIYGLADAIRDKLENEVSDLYREEVTQGFNSNDYLKLFRHIKDNQIFYNTYFKWDMTTITKSSAMILPLPVNTFRTDLLNIIQSFSGQVLHKS